MRRHWALIAVGVLLAAALVAVLVGRSTKQTTKGNGTSAAAVTIRAADGTDLSAYVIPPAGGATSLAPLLIMPGSWATGSKEYVKAGEKLAAQGYEVISYAQRGFRPSLGLADFAEQKTQIDLSTIIDWALAHTRADKSRIGAVGISYGAGVSLLAAERDARIKAVVGMTVWGDLGAAMDPNQTLNRTAVSGLMSSGATAGVMTEELNLVRREVPVGISAGAESMLNAAARSPMTGVAALNRNRTAVMLANGFQDSLIMPNQLVTFFNALTGPKRLELQRGDHGSAEWTGLEGQSNEVWQNATKWLDHYVRGIDNGVQNDDPIQLRDMTTNTWHAYKDWSQIGQSTSLTLGTVTAAEPTGAISAAGAAGSDWTRSIVAGVPTLAESPRSQPDQAVIHLPTAVPISQVSRSSAVVWVGPALTTPLLVNGSPRLHLTVTPSGTAATFFAYLYDVDPATGGSLMTYVPYSVVGATPGQPQSVDVDFEATSWTVPAGHHLALVIDTVDGRFASRNTPGSSLTFSSSASDPARLGLVTGG